MVPFFMTCKYKMRIQILSLVDITNTSARRNEDKKLYCQQSNYSTVIQTSCLRVNMVPFNHTIEFGNINQLGFGNRYKNRQKYWSIIFENEYTNSITLPELEDDFDLVPIVLNLDETAKIETPVFSTKDATFKNLVFNILE